jgi:tRNA (guanine-N7-)-methyltransferase
MAESNYLIRTTSGRQAGRLSRAQKEAIEKVLPGIDITSSGLIEPWKIFGRRAPLYMEIGFGTGEFLYNMAIKHPDVNFIGIELYIAGVAKLLRRMVDYDNTRKPLPENVRIMIKDIREALNEQFNDESIDGIYILFPDPWPKKRHHKRRLINCGFAGLVKRKLKRGGFVVVATDHPEYAEVIEDAFLCSSFLKSECDIPEVYQTKYAQKAIRDRRSVYAFKFIK